MWLFGRQEIKCDGLMLSASHIHGTECVCVVQILLEGGFCLRGSASSAMGLINSNDLKIFLLRVTSKKYFQRKTESTFKCTKIIKVWMHRGWRHTASIRATDRHKGKRGPVYTRQDRLKLHLTHVQRDLLRDTAYGPPLKYDLQLESRAELAAPPADTP